MDRKLRAFLAVTRSGNLTAAAEATGLTQPALTKTIQRLEAEVGAQLFSRSTKGMQLSPAGEAFLRRARAIETHWAQAREEAHARSDGILAEFRIAAGAAYHMRIAPLLVRRLAKEFEASSFTLDFDVAGVMLPKLQCGEIDLLLGAFIHDIPDGIDTVKLLEVQNVAMCCRDNPLSSRRNVPPSALQDSRWVVYKRDSFMADKLSAYYRQFQLAAPRVVMEVDSLASTMLVVSGTPYLTVIPTTLVPMARDAGLMPLHLDVPIWSFFSGAWMRRSTQDYPILRRALALLTELCAAADHSQ